MGAAFEVKIKGLKEMVEWSEATGPMFQQTMKEGMSIIGLHIVERSRVNAPIDTGDLRRSINSKVLSASDGILVNITVGVDYALRMHEFLTPFGPLQLGPGSRREGAANNAPEGGVGGKFLERVVNFHIGNYITYIRDLLEENLGDLNQTIKISPETGPILGT